MGHSRWRRSGVRHAKMKWVTYAILPADLAEILEPVQCRLGPGFTKEPKLITHNRAKEKRFLDALESLFTGAEVEGDSGFINLMRMKRGYFKSIRPKLMEAIDKRAEKDTAFREELFDKLYTFFSRYFCESGSIYFRHLPAFSKTYERVYADGEDVALSWKTQMLYYVKSDILARISHQ